MTALVVYLQNTVARLRDREGQTMAEYALILPLIEVLVSALIAIRRADFKSCLNSTSLAADYYTPE